MLWSAVFLSPTLAIFFWFMAGEDWYWRFLGLFIIVSVAGFVLAQAIANIRADREFVCRLTTETLECICPVKSCGDSFAIKLNAVTKIEEEKYSESPRWYVWDESGKRYWLTGYFGNPVDKFVDQIHELRPDVTSRARTQ